MQNRTFTDQMGEKVTISYPPQRIISIVPSQTELLFYFDLEPNIIGITKFCIHPHQHFKAKQKIGGTKNLNIPLIRELNPDLIIGNKEENAKADIDILKKEFPVWMSDIFDLDDALKMITSIGNLTKTTPKSQALVHEIRKNFKTLEHYAPKQPLKAAYLIWQNPLITVGSNTFINDMLKRAGFFNVFGDDMRYPEINIEQLIQKQPDIILLSSEPYPFKDKHIQYFKKHCPDAKVVLVDGEYFSWYGNRIKGFPQYATNLLTEIQGIT